MNTRELTGYEKTLLAMLPENQGYYDCPKDITGARLGKLVGYAGEYETTEGSGEYKHYVGERYWNFPRGAERNPLVMSAFVQTVVNQLRDRTFRSEHGEIDCTFGLPQGGLIPAFEIARLYGCNYSCADKEVLELKTATSREKSRLTLGRHTVEKGWRIGLVEDLGNNFSTTDKAIRLVKEYGGIVTVIICMINRSPEGLTIWNHEGRSIPIVQAVLIPTPEYRQDDPYVAADVEAGNVVWKPKNNWDDLLQVA